MKPRVRRRWVAGFQRWGWDVLAPNGDVFCYYSWEQAMWAANQHARIKAVAEGKVLFQ